MAAARRHAKLERGPEAAPDPDEEQALAAATAALAGCRDPKSAAYACISAWIQKRAELTAGARMTETVAFDLGDAQLRGVIAACLPSIGNALCGLPADKPFFELSKDQVIDVFAAGLSLVREAKVRAMESPHLLDDEIPF